MRGPGVPRERKQTECTAGGRHPGRDFQGRIAGDPDCGDYGRGLPVTIDGENMEVLAVRASDGTIRTAFNTCQSCYTSGAGFYRFEEGELICNNCGFHFSPDQVQVASGGCNPWPIFEEDKTVTADSISISYDFLSESKGIFANWKTAVR